MNQFGSLQWQLGLGASGLQLFQALSGRTAEMRIEFLDEGDTWMKFSFTVDKEQQ